MGSLKPKKGSARFTKLLRKASSGLRCTIFMGQSKALVAACGIMVRETKIADQQSIGT